MTFGLIQCLYSFNGEKYGHDVALEIERREPSAYILTLSSIHCVEATRTFQCHPFVLAAVCRGEALTITDDTTIEVSFVPTGQTIQIEIRDLDHVPTYRSFVAEFKLYDLKVCLAALTAFA